MKAKKYLIIILLMLASNNMFSQTKNNYKQQFTDTISEVKTEKEYNQKTNEFFLQIENKNLPIALAEISKGKDINQIAYDLFSKNKNRLSNKEVQKGMLNQLSIENNSPEFKYVLIDFISTELKGSKELNTEVYEIAMDRKQPDGLRGYAAAHIAKTENYNELKIQLTALIESNNKSVINGASKVIASIIKSGIPKSEENYWVDKVITQLDKNQDNLLEIKGAISALGKIESKKAKDKLLEYFDQNSSSNKKTSEIFAYALANNIDTKGFNTVFSAYHKNEHFNNFGSELLLKRMANNNSNILDDLNLGKDSESKLNYLRAVKHLKLTEREKHLNNVTNSLKSENAQIRLEAIKTLHFILPHEEEVKLFKKHALTEKNDEVKNEIFFYVGR